MSKREIPDKGIDLENRKKKRLKKLICWLAIDLSVAFIIFALLLYKPGRYNPTPIESDEVSPYLTKLSSEIHNKSQLDKSFDIVITQEALNDIINRADWPLESDGVLLYAPSAVINPDIIVLMGTADFQGVEFILTVELKAHINENGLLNVNVLKVKVGALNITPLAKITAKKMYAQKLEEIGGNIDIYSWQTKIIASLLNEEAIEPVFDIERQTLKVGKITIEEGKATVNLIPIK